MDVIVLNVSDGTKVQTPDTKSYINVENAAVVMDLLILNHKEQAVDPKLIASSHLTKRRSSSTIRLEARLCPRVLFLALTVFLRSLELLISRKNNRPGLVSMIRLSAQPLPSLTWGGADSDDVNSVARQSNAHFEASPSPRNRLVDLMPGRRVARLRHEGSYLGTQMRIWGPPQALKMAQFTLCLDRVTDTDNMKCCG
jgi:hypothetical protein